MATQKQLRDRARRRAAKRESALVARQAREQRNRQAIVVVLVVLAVVAGFIALTAKLRSKDTSVAEASASSTTTFTPLVAGCTQAPAAPGTAAVLPLPDAASVSGKDVTLTLATNCGQITMHLDSAKAPQATAALVALAQADYYRDAPCHRIVTTPNALLQCGDPLGTGAGNPGFGYAVENAPADGVYPKGTVAMARTDDLQAGTAGQFFIVEQESTWDPAQGGYSIVGTVTEGMDIVDAIVAAGTTTGGPDGSPAQPISILRASVTEK